MAFQAIRPPGLLGGPGMGRSGPFIPPDADGRGVMRGRPVSGRGPGPGASLQLPQGRDGFSELLAGGGGIDGLIQRLQGQLGEKPAGPPGSVGDAAPGAGGRYGGINPGGGDPGGGAVGRPISITRGQPEPPAMGGGPVSSMPFKPAPTPAPTPGPAPDPQEAQPADAVETPAAAPTGRRPGGLARIGRGATAPPRHSIARRPSSPPPGSDAAFADIAEAAPRPPTGARAAAISGAKGRSPRVKPMPARAPGGPSTSLRPAPSNVLTQLPARMPGGGGLPYLPQKPVQVSGVLPTLWQKPDRSSGPQNVAPPGGWGGNQIRGPAPGMEDPGAAAAPTLATLPGQLSPEQDWAMQNMPDWMRERGVDSAGVLNFIQKNPNSPLAQQFASAGLG